MAEFSEDQRIVIRALAAEAAESAVEVLLASDDLPHAIDGRIGAKLPLMGKAERLFSHWQAVAAIVVAVPLAGVGLKSLIDKVVDEKAMAIKMAVSTDLLPRFDATSKELNKFRVGLADQLESSVDSATTKLLRFGCNKSNRETPEAPGFPACSTEFQEVEAANNARNVLEVHEQTIVFKKNSGQQALLLLRLQPADGLPLLGHVGVRLVVPPLLSESAYDKEDAVRLTPEDLPDTHKFVEPNSGMLKLVGRVKDRSDREPLNVEVDITKHLSSSTVHALRLRADRLIDAPENVAYRGNERFFVLATVIVTHRLSRE